MAEQKSNRKVLWITAIAAVVMFAFCFAMVPLYSLLCKQTGINTSATGGTLLTAASRTVTPDAIDLNRSITVQFIAINHKGLPWDFYPKVKSVTVHPGENNKVIFYVKNTTEKSMTVQAIPSMTPTDALSYFHKIECFCFTQQTLKGMESKDMPMIFRIDKTIPKEIRVITLAYTLFDVGNNSANAKKG